MLYFTNKVDEEDELRDEGYLSVQGGVLKKRKSGEGKEFVTKREMESEIGRKGVKKEKKRLEDMKIEEIDMVTTELEEEEEELGLEELENTRVSKRLKTKEQKKKV